MTNLDGSGYWGLNESPDLIRVVAIERAILCRKNDRVAWDESP